MENDIDRNLPYHDYFEWFGPRFRLEVPENNMEDVNQKDGYLEGIKQEVLKHLEDLPHAPSVSMQNVPGESLAEHIGYTAQEDDDLSELDERIAGHVRRAYESRDSSPSGSEEGITTPLNNDPYAFSNPFYVREEAYYSDDSEASGRSRSRRKTRQNFNMPNYHNPNAPSIFNTFPNNSTPRPTRKSNSTKRKFFSSSLVWDTDRREVVQIESGLRWRPGALNRESNPNKYGTEDGGEGPLSINGDEEVNIGMDDEDAEMEEPEPDIDGMDEDAVEETRSILTNGGDGYRLRGSVSRATSIIR